MGPNYYLSFEHVYFGYSKMSKGIHWIEMNVDKI
jgi:hypothetical protein